MEHDRQGSDRVHHGEASLGEAQAANPPDDREMIEPGAEPLDTDTDYVGEDPPPPAVDEPDDPAPHVP